MKNLFVVGIVFGLIWALVKGVMIVIDPMMNPTPAIYANIFLLMLAIGFGLWNYLKENPDVAYLDKVKSGMKTGVSYMLVVSLAMALFYGVWNSNYFTTKIAESDKALVEMLQDEEKVLEIREARKDLKDADLAKIESELKKAPRSFFNTQSHVTISVLGMLLLATLYSLLIPVALKSLQNRR